MARVPDGGPCVTSIIRDTDAPGPVERVAEIEIEWLPLAASDGLTVSVALDCPPAARLNDDGLHEAVQPPGTAAESPNAEPAQFESVFFTVTV